MIGLVVLGLAVGAGFSSMGRAPSAGADGYETVQTCFPSASGRSRGPQLEEDCLPTNTAGSRDSQTYEWETRLSRWECWVARPAGYTWTFGFEKRGGWADPERVTYRTYGWVRAGTVLAAHEVHALNSVFGVSEDHKNRACTRGA